MGKQKKMNIPTDIDADVVETLEEFLAESNRILDPKSKAEVTVLLCEEIHDQELSEAKNLNRSGVRSITERLVRKLGR